MACRRADADPKMLRDLNIKAHQVRHVANSLSYCQGATLDEILASGLITRDIGPTGRDDRYGYGLVDAHLAVETAVSLSGNDIGPPTPQIEITPLMLNFLHNKTNLELSITNGGNDNLVVQEINSGLTNWLTISSSNVNTGGFGTYTVNVDRNGLLQDTYV